MKTFIQIIMYGFLAVLIAGGIALIYKYTNGFNEDFKTFYIERNGEQILTANSKVEFDPEEANVFTVKYTFDKQDAEPKDFTVKVLPNATTDFDFTVDNKAYKYSKAKELTDAFEIVKTETSFEIKVDVSQNVQEVLKSVYGGTVIVPKAQADKNEYPFTLAVSSYNGNVNYRIAFKIKGVSEIQEVVIPPDPSDKPEQLPVQTQVTGIDMPTHIVFTGVNT